MWFSSFAILLSLGQHANDLITIPSVNISLSSRIVYIVFIFVIVFNLIEFYFSFYDSRVSNSAIFDSNVEQNYDQRATSAINMLEGVARQQFHGKIETSVGNIQRIVDVMHAVLNNLHDHVLRPPSDITSKFDHEIMRNQMHNYEIVVNAQRILKAETLKSFQSIKEVKIQPPDAINDIKNIDGTKAHIQEISVNLKQILKQMNQLSSNVSTHGRFHFYVIDVGATCLISVSAIIIISYLAWHG